MAIGIYKITSSKSDKCYIGSSVHIDKRFKDHIDMLVKGSHHSSKLQKHFNEESPQLILTIIDKCAEHELPERELFYIKKFNSYKKGFNCSLNTSRYSGIKTSLSYIKLLEKINQLKSDTNFMNSKMKFSVTENNFSSNKTSYNFGRAYKLLVYVEHLYNINTSNVVIHKFAYNISQKPRLLSKMKSVDKFTNYYEYSEVVPSVSFKDFMNSVINDLMLSCGLEQENFLELYS